MTETYDQLRRLLLEFDTAMLVTKTHEGGLRARPMAVADVEPDGTLWLLTDRSSGKRDEITDDNHVNITMQSSMKFVSFSGRIFSSEDRTKLDEIWKDSWKIWFPGGKVDPNLVLLRIEGESGEYWDESGLQGIRYLFEAGKAYLTGTRPSVDGQPRMHSKVEL